MYYPQGLPTTREFEMYRSGSLLCVSTVGQLTLTHFSPLQPSGTSSLWPLRAPELEPQGARMPQPLALPDPLSCAPSRRGN